MDILGAIGYHGDMVQGARPADPRLFMSSGETFPQAAHTEAEQVPSESL